MRSDKQKVNIKIILMLFCSSVLAKHIISLPFFESMDKMKFMIALIYSAINYVLLLFIINLIIVSIRKMKDHENV